MPMEDFFRRPEELGKHPLLPLVASRLRKGEKVYFEVYRPQEAFGLQTGKVYLHFRHGDEEVDVDVRQDDWDDDLNEGLIRLGVRSIDADAERNRFVLGLREAFRKPEKRFGDGYFNAVLVKFVRDREELRDHPEVADVLRHIHGAKPHEGNNYPYCVEMIQDAIQGRAVELNESLGYPIHDAWNLLAGALAGYLAERFSVTGRRLLGLL